MVSRYGVWLLVGLCTPMKNVVLPDLTGMLSMLFEWYKVIMRNDNDNDNDNDNENKR